MSTTFNAIPGFHRTNSGTGHPIDDLAVPLLREEWPSVLS